MLKIKKITNLCISKCYRVEFIILLYWFDEGLLL